MSFFTPRWLSPYIGSWLLFQGAINLSVFPGTNLGQNKTAPAETTGQDASTALLSATNWRTDTAPDQSALAQVPAADVARPWQLPNASTPLATVRVTEGEPVGLAYTAGDIGPNPAIAPHCVQWNMSKATTALPFQVRINEQAVAEFPQREQAYRFGKQLQALFLQPDMEATALSLTLDGDAVVGQWQQQRLFTVDPDLAAQVGHSTGVIAVTWVNALRDALKQPPLAPATVAPILAGLTPTERQFSGTASWYGPYFHGRITANGETFDQNALTAAHPSLPFNTYLKVTNQNNGRAVVVRINDRGPYVGRRSLDLSKRAASCLNSEVKGVVPYKATILKPT